MKTKCFCFALLLLLALGIAFPRAAESPTELLQKGLLEEEANRNLNAAIQAYQSVVNQFDEQRKLAATAMFRLAESYRKLGKLEEAKPLYMRIVREFSDQPELVRLSNRYVETPASALTSATMPPVERTLSPAEVRFLEEEIKLVETQIAEAEKRQQNGTGSVEAIVALRRELLGLRRKLPANNSPASRQALIEEEIKLVERSVVNAQKRVEVGLVAPMELVPLKRDLLVLQRELAALDNPSASATQQAPDAPDEEAREIQRLKAMVQNSPDLLNRGDTDSEDFTPLTAAASRGQLRVAKYLIDAGADIDRLDRDGRGETALMRAVRAGHKAMVELLLDSKASISKEVYGQTPLHEAATRGYKAVAETLLSHGANLSGVAFGQRNGGPTGTPLHFAAANGHDSVVDLFLRRGADVNAKDLAGRTPLLVATSSGKFNVVERLLAGGADVRVTDSNGLTPLHFAARADAQRTTELLLEHGADVNALSQTDGAPLHLAAVSGGVEALTTLLNHKPNLELRNQLNLTPLGWVASTSRVGLNKDAVMRLLLEAGANPNSIGPEGRTPVFSVLAMPQLVGLILKHGANPNIADESGRSPLDYVETRQSVPLIGGTGGRSGRRGGAGFDPPPTAADYDKSAEQLREAGAKRGSELGAVSKTTTQPIVRPGPNPGVVYLSGQIQKVGPVEILGNEEFTVSKAILRAGGLGNFADKKKVKVVRRTGPSEKDTKEFIVNVEEILEKGRLEQDIKLEPGDLIIVPSRANF